MSNHVVSFLYWVEHRLHFDVVDVLLTWATHSSKLWSVWVCVFHSHIITQRQVNWNSCFMTRHEIKVRAVTGLSFVLIQLHVLPCDTTTPLSFVVCHACLSSCVLRHLQSYQGWGIWWSRCCEVEQRMTCQSLWPLKNFALILFSYDPPH